MNLLAVATVVVTGFVACAEFGSYALVRPALHRLAARERITVEQGLLRTFGRVMPVGMPVGLVLTIAGVVAEPAPLSWMAAIAFAVAVTTTVLVNVPINLATARWDPAYPPADWQRTRRRWARFQAFRSWLLLIGFVTAAAAAV
ncbi:DUF1772 domain-containing protein [Pseudonocardia aurantiaca]|uniref:Anthrone oxygenase family protein n=1 Tax=Pseudonocardia aurantiaca TaxID=75290 RepID=A0ABW4FFU5_9PSEU